MAQDTPSTFGEQLSFAGKTFLLVVAVIYAVPKFYRAVIRVANAITAFARLVPHLEKLPFWMDKIDKWMEEHQKTDSKTFAELQETLAEIRVAVKPETVARMNIPSLPDNTGTHLVEDKRLEPCER